MKKAFFTIVMFLIMHTGFSQVNNSYQSTLDSLSKIVIHYLQTKQSDSIYALAGESFKTQLSAETFRSVSQNQVFPLNNFANTTFVNTTNGINKYKVSGTPDLQLFIGLDKANKLQTLLIQPYSNN